MKALRDRLEIIGMHLTGSLTADAEKSAQIARECLNEAMAIAEVLSDIALGYTYPEFLHDAKRRWRIVDPSEPGQ